MRKVRLKQKRSQIEYNTNRANAKKAFIDSLLKDFEAAKKELIKLTQDERKLETTGDQDKDKTRTDTAAQVNHYLDQNKLPTPKEGTRKEQDNPIINNNEI